MALRYLLGPVVCCAAALVLLTSAAFGQEPSRTTSDAPLRFRRVFAPAERIEDWPRGAARYVPVEGDEFERLIRATQETATVGPRAATLVRAEYEAEYTGGDDLRGGFTWTVGLRGTASATLNIEPLGIALDAAAWKSSARDVALGLASDGQPVLLVDQAGELVGKWSLRGRRDNEGPISFNFEAPAATAAVLHLTVPRGIVPTAANGLIALVEDRGERQTYRILFGGQTLLALRLVGQVGEATGKPAVVLRENCVYDISPRGVDLVTVWKLDVHATPVKSLRVLLDAGLQLVSARLGEVDVPFTVVERSRDEETEVALELADPLTGYDRPLRLVAIAPLSLEAGWRLPKIRPVNASWQEGTCTLLVHDPLLTTSLTTQDCRQTRYAVLPEPNRGESFDVQLFDEAAAVELSLSRQSDPPRVSSGLDVAITPDEARAEIVAMLQVASGKRWTLSADWSPAWTLDTVESVPRDALGGWSFDAAAAAPRLNIRLNRPLVPEGPIRLVLRARRAASAQAGIWRYDELRPLTWRDARVDEQLITLRPPADGQAEVRRVQGMRGLTPGELDGRQIALFSDLPVGMVYQPLVPAAEFQAELETRSPRIRCDVTLRATIDAKMLHEAYTWQCEPSGEAIDQVLVHFSQARDTPAEFRLLGAGARPLAGRRLTAEELSARKLPTAGETWLVALDRPRTAAFGIQARRETPRVAETALALGALLGAERGVGTVIVCAAADQKIVIHAAGVTPLAAQDEADDACVRARFQYTAGAHPGQITIVGDEAVLAPASAALVAHRRIETRYDASGTVDNLATFRVRNAGQKRVRLTAPVGNDITRIWLAGVEQQTPAAAPVEIALDPAREEATLVVEYRGACAPLASGEQLTAPLMEIDVPVVESDWLVWLPPGFELLDVVEGVSQPGPRKFSWSERLLGPLGRGIGAQPADLQSDSFWRSLWSHIDADADDASRALALRIRDLSTGQTAKLADWGALVTTAAAIASEAGIALVVDGQALADIGVTPRRPLDREPGDALHPEINNGLARAGAVLVAGPKSLLLTSRTAALIDRGNWRWVETDLLAQATSGALLRSLQAPGGDPSFQTAAEWNVRQADVSPAIASLGGDAAVGYLITGNAERPPSVVVLYAPSAVTWGSAACTLMMATCICFLRRPRMLMVAFVFAAAAALLAPPLLATVATGAMWGIALALVWLAWASRRPLPRDEEVHLSASHSHRSVATSGMFGALLAVLSLALLAASATAQQAATRAAEKPADVVHRVFIPVDEQEQPTADKYQVPEVLYDELRRRASDTATAPEDWLIRSARYQVALQTEGSNESLTAKDVLVEYQVQVLRPQAMLRLPVIGVRPGLLARLDDRPIDLDWETDEDGLICRFDEPGNYQVKMSLRPARGEGGTGSLDLAIPAVPEATLEVAVPAGGLVVETPTAFGVPEWSADNRRLHVELGPARRLTVRWSSSRQARQNGPSGGEADLWQWLQIQPSGVVLHARLELHGLKGATTQLTLAVDPRLRALPILDRTGTVANVQPVAGDPQLVRIELARPVTERATIPLSFLLTGSSGVGDLALPRIVPQGLRIGQRVLAVSVDPALESQPDLGGHVSIAVADFINHWGAATTTPQFAVRLVGSDPWTIATRPRAAALAAKERLVLEVDGGRVGVYFDAQIAPLEAQQAQGSQALQYRLQLPPPLEIEKITLVHDGVDRVGRWARDADGVTIFLVTPVSGRQQLTLDGWIPCPVEGNWELPRCGLATVGRRDLTLVVTRRPSVLAAIHDQQGLTKTDDPRTAVETAATGRLVAAYVEQDENYSAQVKIAPNIPRVRSLVLTSLVQDATGWAGKIDYRANVVAGCLDTVTFRLPDGWTGPFEVNPPAATEIVEGGEPGRRLVVRPRVALDGTCQLLVRSPLKFAEGDAFFAPTLVASPEEQSARYLLLPEATSSGRLAWNTVGMLPDALPADAVGLAGIADQAIYRVTEDVASATRKALPARGVAATTADITLAWSPTGPARGVATFVVVGAGTQVGQLVMPEQLQILALRADGVPITPERDGPGWRIPFDAERVQQVIEVVFQDDRRESSLVSPIRLDAPALLGPEVVATHWQVYGPGDAGEPVLWEEDRLPAQMLPDRVNAGQATTVGRLRFSGVPTRWSFAGSAPQVTIRYLPTAWFYWSGRWLAAITLVALGLILARSAGRGAMGRLIARWPYILGIGLGLLLWAWISPGWPGALLSVGCFLAACGPELWRNVLQPQAATTYDG